MRTRMLLAITLALMVVGGMIVYTFYEPERTDFATGSQRERNVEEGAKLFAANCSQCHGPRGEGAIGPALDRAEWKGSNPENDTAGNMNFVRNTLFTGKADPQPGVSMPAWSRSYGGSMDDEQIENLVNFVIYGDWSKALAYTSSPVYIGDLPAAGAETANEYDAQGKLLKTGTASTLKTLLQTKGCLNCHAIGPKLGSTLAPNLSNPGVGSRRSRDWLYKWIENPAAVRAEERGTNLFYPLDGTVKLFPFRPTFMPTIPMTVDERNRIVDYLSHIRAASNNPTVYVDMNGNPIKQ